MLASMPRPSSEVRHSPLTKPKREILARSKTLVTAILFGTIVSYCITSARPAKIVLTPACGALQRTVLWLHQSLPHHCSTGEASPDY
jgi:hypothetical protein